MQGKRCEHLGFPLLRMCHSNIMFKIYITAIVYAAELLFSSYASVFPQDAAHAFRKIFIFQDIPCESHKLVARQIAHQNHK